MLGTFARLFGTKNDRYVKTLEPVVAAVNAHRDVFSKLSDAELKAKTTEFRSRLEKGETLDDLLPEAFAAVREATGRTLGTPHYDVQLMGGIVLHRGMITEMKTGEGKTQVAALAAYLNALPGKGVHVVTVNDYLAKRDAEWMGEVYAALGLTCRAVTHDLAPQGRRESYAADITYATNNELGFDYLRDNMAFAPEQQVQRPLYYAVVDEVDSILIDEARTPLIISGPTEDKTALYTAVNDLFPKFAAEDYVLDEKQRSVTLTEVGTDKAEALLKEAGLLEDGNLYDMQNIQLVHHVNQALRANTLFQRDVDYIVKDGEVVIIDEFTGRMMPGRRFSEGLHQALEAREGVDIKTENQTLASITFQNYFRLYYKLAGMTGTAVTEAEEFGIIYGLRVIEVPTHVPVARIDEPDVIYRTQEEKLRAIVADIKECQDKGQPVLVGTTSIEKSEELSKHLKKQKIKHQVLNARYHEQEAEIIAQAGRKGAVTIATNMAGRGTDIKLGGNLDLLLEEASGKSDEVKIKQAYEQEKAEVMKAGGLRVVATERHESRRIDNQLRGRSGRQGDVGSSVFYISLQDDLMRIFASGLDVLMQRLDMPENERIQSRIISRALETAQRKIESRNFDVRKHLLKFDDVLNEQRKVIYEQRRELINSPVVSDIVEDFQSESLELLHARCFPAGSHEEEWQADVFEAELASMFAIKADVAGWLKEELGPEEIFEKAQELQQASWQAKRKKFGEQLLQGMEKAVLLQILDTEWKDHLQRLDDLRKGITLRGYGQKDPVNEYKREAFSMFEVMLGTIRDEVVRILAHQDITEEELREIEAEQQRVLIEQQRQAELAAAQKSGMDIQIIGEPKLDPQAVANTPEGFNPYAHLDISRNAECPCGSGKRYKHCHGKLPALEKTA